MYLTSSINLTGQQVNEMSELVYTVIHLILIIVLAPLVQGLIQKIKALWQGRSGPSIVQPYYNLAKYFKKDRLIPEESSWIFIITPYIVFATMITAALFIPSLWVKAPLGWAGDVILLIGLFALARFFTALAGMDTGSSFGGMGTSRDLTISAIAEPALLLALFAILAPLGTTSLSAAIYFYAEGGFQLLNPLVILVFTAFMIILMTETGRIPIDNPDTHLELTMIHEGMLLEYSGRKLGLMLWATYIKQVLLILLMINLFFPFGIAIEFTWAGIFLSLFFLIIKLGITAVLLACIESLYAKMRLFYVPKLLGTSMILSILAIVVQTLF